MNSQTIAFLAINLIPPLGVCLFSGFRIIREPGNKRWETLFLASIGVFFGLALSGMFVQWSGRQFTCRYDAYALLFDRALGNPSYAIGMYMNTHEWLNVAARIAYSIIFPVLLMQLTLVFSRISVREGNRFLRALAISLSGILLYYVFPVSGPKYAFSGFPYVDHHVAPQVLLLTAPPNGFPSLHMALAVIILYFSRRSTINAAFSFLFLILMIVSTLGTGEHYLLDLLAGTLFAVGVIYLDEQRECISRRFSAFVSRRERSVSPEPHFVLRGWLGVGVRTRSDLAFSAESSDPPVPPSPRSVR